VWPSLAACDYCMGQSQELGGVDWLSWACLMCHSTGGGLFAAVWLPWKGRAVACSAGVCHGACTVAGTAGWQVV
jgi:hypothetical protein